ncbi:MAG: ATP-binding protein [Cyanobacteria bacterium NC_groundwater_1444_Ag_S-0.65um_54_12]|nr:ATP-binding protein [Cyanobacteria bacterium NC_groundwater_1444_Ag_S-0.65um_54_12]
MKADLLKRLFKAIRSEPPSKVNVLLASIVEEERRKGHVELARQLAQILERSSQPSPEDLAPSGFDTSERSFKELPRSRRSNAPLVTVVPPQLIRHQMVLREDIERRFARIEREYAARGRLSKFGLKPRKKILLFGRPGCGKTLGAERLAFNTGLPLLKVRFDSMISSYFGESATNLRSVFDAAMEKPCLLLLDECDFVARSRNEKNDVGEVPRVVNTLLQLLDDYDAPGLLVATTNIEESLDRAIFRRFDDVFEIPKPDSPQIQELLRLSFSALVVSKNIKWKELSERLNGLSAAVVVTVAQSAAKLSILDGRDTISLAEIERAIAELEETRGLQG